MATKAKTSTDETITYTVAECASQIGVSQDKVIRWIEGGYLSAFCPPGHALKDGQRGPKHFRIFRSDWENFLRARTVTGNTIEDASVVAVSQSVPARPARMPTGTDGVARCGRKSRRLAH